MAACTTAMSCYRSVAEQIQASTTGVGRSGIFPLVSVRPSFEEELALRWMIRLYCFSRGERVNGQQTVPAGRNVMDGLFLPHAPGSRRG